MNIKLLFLLLIFHIKALSQSITGIVQDSAANVPTSVNVLLVSAKDSGLVKPFSIDAPGFSSVGSIKMDTRLLMINVAYGFGNQKLKSSRQRKTAAEEEIQRTN